MPGRDTATLMAEAKAPHTVVSLISVTWHPTAGFHCWGHVRRRKHCQCQAEFLDSPMAASFIRSVNVGQDNPDTKEFTRISFRYEGQSPESDYGNSVSSLTHHAAGDKQPSPMRIDHASGVHSVALHIQKMDAGDGAKPPHSSGH